MTPEYAGKLIHMLGTDRVMFGTDYPVMLPEHEIDRLLAIDLTPDVASDNDGKTPEAVKAVRYHATSSTAGKKNLYNYRKLVCDGVEQTDESLPLLAVYVDFYYVGDVDYEKDAYGALPLYLYTDIWDTYEPSGAEMKAIRNYND